MQAYLQAIDQNAKYVGFFLRSGILVIFSCFFSLFAIKKVFFILQNKINFSFVEKKYHVKCASLIPRYQKQPKFSVV